jgi:hypothetical protein
MNIDPQYLDISFEGIGVRNSQKRLKSLINDLAVEPLNQYQDPLLNRFDMVQEIVEKRVAAVIAYWCQHKHDPVRPTSQDMMSAITNSTRVDMTLEEFYVTEVKNAMHTLAPTLGLVVPDDIAVDVDELELVLLELEEIPIYEGDGAGGEYYDDDEEDDDYEYEEALDFNMNYSYEDDYGEDEADLDLQSINLEGDFSGLTALVGEQAPALESSNGAGEEHSIEQTEERTERKPKKQERAIEKAQQQEVVEQAAPEIHVDVLQLSSEQAWDLVHSWIGYPSEYIQQTMLPRWQQEPETFNKDRRFLYGLFIDGIRNAAGVQYVGGNFLFRDRRHSVDELWNHYFTDLSRQVGPQLTAAKLLTAANEPWHKKLRRRIAEELKNVSFVWMVALVIALIFDGLTTYISLDQTPMEGAIVIVFTVLITALFQIADQLVINYRRREFDAEALAAKYRAQFEKLKQSIDGLDITSDSYVQMSMERSKAHADWKAAEDNRKMARRGRFWSARIADINVIVTAYGFAYLFLDATEPAYALAQQIDNVFVKNAWESVDLWVFLMIGLAVTVSFVVNTAQRTEILGWSMRRLRRES